MGLKIYIGFSGTFEFTGEYDDVTSRVVSNLTYETGVTSPFELVNNDFSTVITLDNTDKIFSPENTFSPLYGQLVPFIPVAVVYDDTFLFTGFVKDYQPVPFRNNSNTKIQRTINVVVGNSKFLLDQADFYPPILKDKTADEIIKYVFENVAFPPAVITNTWRLGSDRLDVDAVLAAVSQAMVLDAGVVTFPFTGDNLHDGNDREIKDKKNLSDRTSTKTAWDLIKQAVSGELGFFFFDRRGRARLFNRYAFLDAKNPTWTSYDSTHEPMDYASLEQAFFNRFQVEYNPRLSESDEIVWRLPQPLQMTANSTHYFYVDVGDRRAVSKVEPVQVDDILATHPEDITVAAEEQGQKIFLTVTNNRSGGNRILGITLRGTFDLAIPTSFEIIDGKNLISPRFDRTLTAKLDLIGSPNAAREWLFFQKNWRKHLLGFVKSFSYNYFLGDNNQPFNDFASNLIAYWDFNQDTYFNYYDTFSHFWDMEEGTNYIEGLTSYWDFQPSVSPDYDNITDGLVSYWSLEESSGTRNDSWGTNHLTDINTVTSTTGKQGDAAFFTAANNEHLRIVTNSSLNTGDIDFTFSAWVKLASKSATQRIIAKWGGSGSFEYLLQYNQPNDRFAFLVSPNGTTTPFVLASTFGSPSIDTWYHIIAYHDSVNNLIGISVNGTEDSTAHTTGVYAGGTDNFTLSDSGIFWDGAIDEVGFWKRRLTTSELEWLYNSGDGRSFAELEVTSNYLNLASNKRPDLVGSNDLYPYWYSTPSLVGYGQSDFDNYAYLATSDDGNVLSTISNPSDLDYSSSDDWYLGFWVYVPDYLNTVQPCVLVERASSYGGTLSSRAFKISTFINTGEVYLKFEASKNSGTSYGTSDSPLTTGSLLLDDWNYVEYYYDSSSNTWKAGVNGTRITLTNHTSDYASIYSGGSNSQIRFGQSLRSVKIDNAGIWTGTIPDDLAKDWLYNYKRGRTSDELLSQEGVRTDKISTSHLVETIPNTVDKVAGLVDYAASFSASQLTSSITDLEELRSLTFWIKFDTADIGTEVDILGCWGTSGNYTFKLSKDTNDQWKLYYSIDGTTPSNVIYSTLDAMVEDTWYNIIIGLSDSGVVRLGQDEVYETKSVDYTTWFSPTSGFQIGFSTTGFTGYIDQVLSGNFLDSDNTINYTFQKWFVNEGFGRDFVELQSLDGQDGTEVVDNIHNSGVFPLSHSNAIFTDHTPDGLGRAIVNQINSANPADDYTSIGGQWVGHTELPSEFHIGGWCYFHRNEESRIFDFYQTLSTFKKHIITLDRAPNGDNTDLTVTYGLESFGSYGVDSTVTVYIPTETWVYVGVSVSTANRSVEILYNGNLYNGVSEVGGKFVTDIDSDFILGDPTYNDILFHLGWQIPTTPFSENPTDAYFDKWNFFQSALTPFDVEVLYNHGEGLDYISTTSPLSLQVGSLVRLVETQLASDREYIIIGERTTLQVQTNPIRVNSTYYVQPRQFTTYFRANREAQNNAVLLGNSTDKYTGIGQYFVAHKDANIRHARINIQKIEDPQSSLTMSLWEVAYFIDGYKPLRYLGTFTDFSYFDVFDEDYVMMDGELESPASIEEGKEYLLLLDTDIKTTSSTNYWQIGTTPNYLGENGAVFTETNLGVTALDDTVALVCELYEG